MTSRKLRIGIDVGGTFTDAVVIDNESNELIAKEKVPTTHTAEQGVAAGIVEAIALVLKKNQLDPQDVIFIAHGTTQATNALLEGDVAHVGIIGMGKGAGASRAKKETFVGNIELAPGKFLETEHEFIESSELDAKSIEDALKLLVERGSEVVVASEAYSVDDPTDELAVIDKAQAEGLLATGGHEISQLYGLQARTRTAAVNAALIPKMMETANMTEGAVKDSGISRPLMIMRCDGGVMSIDEVRKRPILTMLSGLAAGVAGALMYEKITDGIFLEAGGTSTDISAIKDGKVMIKNATVGGRKLYLTSLDVRTLGIAGGSMVVVENGNITDVGPRSAHIANLAYECFSDVSACTDAHVVYVAPRSDDSAHYVALEKDGARVALTLAGAANLLGYVPAGDYAEGSSEATRAAWDAFGTHLGVSAEVAARRVMDIALAKVEAIVKELIADYDLNPNIIHLVGGGGSASVVVPGLSERMGIRGKIAKNAPYISTIGVSLALVREQLERNVSNPTDEDIRRIRHDVTEMIVAAGADAATVEITVEIDAQKNVLRAIATGATELRTKDRTKQLKSAEELKALAAESVSTEGDVTVDVGPQAGTWHVYEVISQKKALFGLIKSSKRALRVLDEEGVIRLQKNNASSLLFTKSEAESRLSDFIDQHTYYSDAGATLPHTYVYFGHKQVDASGIVNKDQLMSLLEMELEFVDSDEPIICVCAKD